jgi:hypothetical protein
MITCLLSDCFGCSRAHSHQRTSPHHMISKQPVTTGCNWLYNRSCYQFLCPNIKQLQLEVRLLPVAVQLGCSFFAVGATGPRKTNHTSSLTVFEVPFLTHLPLQETMTPQHQLSSRHWLLMLPKEHMSITCRSLNNKYMYERRFFVHTTTWTGQYIWFKGNAQSAFSHFTISSSLPNWLYYPLYDPKFNTNAIVAEHLFCAGINDLKEYLTACLPPGPSGWPPSETGIPWEATIQSWIFLTATVSFIRILTSAFMWISCPSSLILMFPKCLSNYHSKKPSPRDRNL